MNATIQRFDGTKAWSELSSEQRNAIGAAALEYAAAAIASHETDDDAIRRATANDMWLAGELFDIVRTSLPDVPFCDMVPSRIGAVCRKCGCTADDACPGGCSWVEEDLCSACA